MTEQFDEAAFERAFDLAAQDILADIDQQIPEEVAAYETGASTGNYEDRVDQARKEAMAAIYGHQRRVSQGFERRVSVTRSEPDAFEGVRDMSMEDSLLKEDAQREEEPKQQDDDDALAATAQELLEKVEHNQTDKFRNSQFLGLMRKLRDREMKVEGDKMVETVRATLKPPTSVPMPDSGYASRTSTPDYYLDYHLARSPPPEFDTHLEFGYTEEHQFDHWESPYR